MIRAIRMAAGAHGIRQRARAGLPGAADMSQTWRSGGSAM